MIDRKDLSVYISKHLDTEGISYTVSGDSDDKPTNVCFSFTQKGFNFHTAFSPEYARELANMFYQVADAVDDEWASMRPKAAKPIKKKVDKPKAKP